MNPNVPEVIPNACGECKYYESRKFFFGRCIFYHIQTYPEAACHVYNLVDEGKLRPEDLQSIPKGSTATSPITGNGTVQTASKQGQALIRRYSDAYLVARAVNGYGIGVKIIGVVAALMLSLIGLVWLGTGRAEDAVMGIVCIAFGLFVGILFYLIGVLISAQGQILKASLDSAVNSSPFLTNEHRAKIMSLPKV